MYVSSSQYQMCVCEHITLTAKPVQIVPYLIVWGCWATLYFYYLVYICKHKMNKKGMNEVKWNEMRGTENSIEFVNLIEWANLFRRGRSIVMGMHNAMMLVAWMHHMKWIYILSQEKNTIIIEFSLCVCFKVWFSRLTNYSMLSRAAKKYVFALCSVELNCL